MSQVYNITHDGAGNSLPLDKLPFISFSYDGKRIEEYNFIATIDGSLDRPFYGEFSYNTSESDVLDGQFYWGTHYNKNTINLRLVTDKITEAQLADFKKWLKPGPAKQFIFAENPNRAIDVRVAETPSYADIIPYEDRQKVLVGNTYYNYSTTYYRGFVEVSFEADEPHWYSLNNVIEGSVDEDKIKIAMEDNVPLDSMIKTTDYPIHLGDRIYKAVPGTDSIECQVVFDSKGIFLEDTIMDSTHETVAPNYLFYGGTAPADTIMKFTFTPKFEKENYGEDVIPDYDYTSIPIFLVGSAEVGNAYTYSVSKAEEIYAGGEHSYSSLPKGLIISPANKITAANGANPYNVITIGNKQFKFTTPSIYTGYNQALTIMDKFKVGDSFLEARTAIREGVNEYYSRAWALAVMNKMGKQAAYVDQSTSKFKEKFKEAFDLEMFQFLYAEYQTDSQETRTTVWPAEITINSKTGEATGSFIVKVISLDENGDPNIEVKKITENVGDMIYDSYIRLEERNHFIIRQPEESQVSSDDYGSIQSSTTTDGESSDEEGEETNNNNDNEATSTTESAYGLYVDKTCCTEITTDYPGGLYDFDIQYKFEYL